MQPSQNRTPSDGHRHRCSHRVTGDSSPVSARRRSHRTVPTLLQSARIGGSWESRDRCSSASESGPRRAPGSGRQETSAAAVSEQLRVPLLGASSSRAGCLRSCCVGGLQARCAAPAAGDLARLSFAPGSQEERHPGPVGAPGSRQGRHVGSQSLRPRHVRRSTSYGGSSTCRFAGGRCTPRSAAEDTVAFQGDRCPASGGAVLR